MQHLRAPTLEEAAKLKRWRISTFWVMLIGYIGYYICRGNISVAIPLISKQLSYSNTELGFVLTASELAYAAGKFINGPLADKFGGKKIFILGMAGAIVFNLLFPLRTDLLWFTIIWCAARYFLSMGWGGIIKTIGEWYPPEVSGTVMGFISVNFQFGGAISVLLAGGLLSLGFGWQGLFFVPAGILAFIMLWSAFASKEKPQDVIPDVAFGRSASSLKSISDSEVSSNEAEAGLLENLRVLIKIPLFRQILVFSFLTTLLRSIFLFWTPKFLVDIGMGDVNAALKAAVFPLLGCIGTIFLGWYTDRYAKNGDRARMMALMLSGLVISLLLTGLLVPYRLEFQHLIVVLLGLSGFFLYGPYSMSSGALTLDVAGAKRAGSCTGMIDGIGYIGGALAAWGAGYLSDNLGWASVFYILAAFAVLSVLSCLFMSHYYQKRSRS